MKHVNIKKGRSRNGTSSAEATLNNRKQSEQLFTPQFEVMSVQIISATTRNGLASSECYLWRAQREIYFPYKTVCMCAWQNILTSRCVDVYMKDFYRFIETKSLQCSG